MYHCASFVIGMEYRLKNESSVPSPALLIDLDAVEENLRTMLKIAGDPARLRPHVKTHKLPQLVAAQVALGIRKFKCATIAEAEMTAAAGGRDILLAVAPVGPNIGRYLKLMRRFPKVNWLTIGDDLTAVNALGTAAKAVRLVAEVLIDLDIGQHRSGVRTKKEVLGLYKALTSLPGLRMGGLHAYDGHVHDPDLKKRTATCDDAWVFVKKSLAALKAAGCPAPVRIVAGGTPTFAIHARRRQPGLECSPGTCVLWDAGYGKKFPDLPFRHAAWLLTRCISRPISRGIDLCLDLGHKAVASEMPHPRVVFPEMPRAEALMHNEEHLVLRTALARSVAPGRAFYGIPWHVCPTVALHAECHVVRDGRAVDVWPIVARSRRITI